MDNDPQTTSGLQEQPDQDRQNRRQFFNGLGKWSLAIVAAVTALRDGLDDAHSGIGSRLDTPSADRGDPRQQIAKGKEPKPKKSHTDIGHVKHSNHLDNVTKPKPPGGTTGTPGGSLDRAQ